MFLVLINDYVELLMNIGVFSLVFIGRVRVRLNTSNVYFYFLDFKVI